MKPSFTPAREVYLGLLIGAACALITFAAIWLVVRSLRCWSALIIYC